MLQLLCKSLKQNPGAAENILKINGQRKYVLHTTPHAHGHRGTGSSRT